jgi:glycosyltransferase involved in cell wall biosynthesis
MVICTLQGEDLFLDSLPHPHSARAWATLAERAGDVDMFIAVSQYYRDAMQKRLTLPDGRIQVVHNGIVPEGFAPAASAPQVPTVGYLAPITYAKGLHTLADAFILLNQSGEFEQVRLRVAGALAPLDEAYLRRIRHKLAEFVLNDAVDFQYNISRAEKQRFLRTVSVLSVPAGWGEACGSYVLEALASGVPVVQPRSGAFEELLELTGGGILVEPDDPQALADGIETLLKDRDLARTLGQRGRQAVLENFTAETMARNFLHVCEMTFHHQRLAPHAVEQ